MPTSRRRLIATATAVVLIVSGGSLVGWSIVTQRTPPQPGPEANGSAFDLGDGEASSTVVPPIAAPSGNPSPQVNVPTLPRSLPVAVDIQSIGVHSVMRSVGLAPNGALEVPAPGPYYDEAAWYRNSPTPGSLGPAIVLGHVDSASGGPSVFFRLGELRAGDRVGITRADGSIAVFVVDEVHTYPKDDFPTKLVYGDIDHAGLRLLTCGGAFDDATGHYLANIVVFASLVNVSS